jgi:hypothetical protein
MNFATSALKGHPATTRSFHLDNRNIDRRNDANTAEFTRTGQRRFPPGASKSAERAESPLTFAS